MTVLVINIPDEYRSDLEAKAEEAHITVEALIVGVLEDVISR